MNIVPKGSSRNLDMRYRHGQVFQYARVGWDVELDESKPFCKLGLSDYSHDFPSLWDGGLREGHSLWPGLTLDAINFESYDHGSYVDLTFWSQRVDSDAVRLNCMSPNPRQVWTIHQIENLMGGYFKFNFKEKSKMSIKGKKTFPIQDLTKIQVSSLVNINKDLGNYEHLTSREKQTLLFIQNRQIEDDIQVIKHEKAHCQLRSQEGLTSQIRLEKGSKLKVTGVLGVSINTLSSLVGSNLPNQMVLYAKIEDDKTQYGLECFLNRNTQEITLAELNQITRGILKFDWNSKIY